MRLKLPVALILLATLAFSAFGVRSIKSFERKRKISDIVKAYHRAGENLHDPDVRAAVMADVSKLLPLNPKEKPDLRSSEEIAAEVRKIVGEKFNRSVDEIREKAQKEAANMFKLRKPLDYVTVLYQRGDTIYKVEGVFYEHGGNSVQIDDRIVALFDLLPKYRTFFDKSYCERKKKEYISDMIQGYYLEKGNFSTQLFKDLKKEQVTTNENRGYIHAWNEWRTPRDVTEIVIRMTARGRQKVDERDIAKALRKSKRGERQPPEVARTDERPAASGDGENGARQDEPPSKESEFDKVKAKAEAKLMNIANTYAGIDADQGYKKALWGFTWREVMLILRDEFVDKDLEKADEIAAKENWLETIKFQSGPLQEIQLYFRYGVFYRVVVVFRIGPLTTMRQVSLRLQERYGMTDEQKKATGRAFSTPSEEKLMKDGKKEEKKKGKKKKEPLHQEFHWTGEITEGVLDIRVNADRTAYESFMLTKENPILREKVTAAKAREREFLEYKKKMEKAEDLEKKVKKIDF